MKTTSGARVIARPPPQVNPDVAMVDNTQPDFVGVECVAETGDVEVAKSVTVQVKQYHPVVVEARLRLPVEQGEAPAEALRRVRGLVDAAVDEAMEEVVRDGFKWSR